MEIFATGIKILLAAAPVFFLIFIILCTGWAKPMHPERKFTIGFLLASLYTFLFFVIGILILAGITILLKYISLAL